jgi:hypothetical protein
MRESTSYSLASAWSAVFAGGFCIAMRGGCIRARHDEGEPR